MNRRNILIMCLIGVTIYLLLTVGHLRRAWNKERQMDIRTSLLEIQQCFSNLSEIPDTNAEHLSEQERYLISLLIKDELSHLNTITNRLDQLQTRNKTLSSLNEPVLSKIVPMLRDVQRVVRNEVINSNVPTYDIAAELFASVAGEMGVFFTVDTSAINTPEVEKRVETMIIKAYEKLAEIEKAGAAKNNLSCCNNG